MSADDIQYKSVPLYGGAIVCDLPENFADVSKLRQVPSYQEVWIDKDGFTSIAIELLDRVEPPRRAQVDEMTQLEIDGAALTEHLMELVGDDADHARVWNSSETEFSRMQDFAAYTLLATITPPERKRGGDRDGGGDRDRGGSADKTPALTAVIMTLLRLKREKTDIVITVNVPHIKGEYDEEDVDFEMGKTGTLIGTAVNYTSKIWETFRVRDFGLFGDADGRDGGR
jgi:hypothetical protein